MKLASAHLRRFHLSFAHELGRCTAKAVIAIAIAMIVVLHLLS